MSSSSWHRRPVHPGKRPNRLVFNLTVSEQRIATIFSPAKINLFLAVTGLRTDGFHDLVSVAAPLHFGDQLIAVVDSGERNSPAQFSLECDVPDVPVDGSNLVLKAAAAFATATGWGESVAFRLEKRIPVGAGLGGGSSNATAALLALNQLSGADLDRATLGALAAAVGSDCPLFLGSGPVIMRGRGEQIEPLPETAVRRLRGRQLLIFKPGLSVSTAWAYGQMAAGAPRTCLPAEEAERRLSTWIAGSADAVKLQFNNLEPVVFRKYLALPVLLDRLRCRFGLAPGMSGSGSACFVALPPDAPIAEIVAVVRDAWGAGCFVRETAIS
jgi:4-diphosphocytidyl-2-C-methyl-D-erythritol kinase